MSSNFYSIIRSVLFCLPAEWSHYITLMALKKLDFLIANQSIINSGTANISRISSDQDQTATQLMGLTFPNKIGLAAGLDKNGECISAWRKMGFGFIEVGTVTRAAQSGNPKPRLFRDTKDKAIINRMGFNNHGVDNLIKNVKDFKIAFENKSQSQSNFPVLGINIGKNKTTPNEKALEDYLYCLDKVYPYADYVTINLSSPNTQGLRDLQESRALAQLLSGLKLRQAQLESQYFKKVPLVVKLSPDMDNGALKSVVSVLLDLNIEGVIASNTTLWRPETEALKNIKNNSDFYQQTGGLSGRPLLHRSLETVSTLSTYLAGKIPIIAVGGIDSKQTAQHYLERGASLLQIYTGLIYQGPALVRDLIA